MLDIDTVQKKISIWPEINQTKIENRKSSGKKGWEIEMSHIEKIENLRIT